MKALLLGILMLLLPATAVLAADATKPADAAHAADDHGDGHGAHLGHAGANTDPAQVKGDLAIFSAVVFLLLVIILRKFAWGPIAAGLEKREGHIAHEIAGAEKANHEAKALLADYQKKLDAAQLEVRGILDEARRDAENAKQATVAEARAEAAAEGARVMRDIEAAKDAAMRELATVAADQALALAGKLLQQKLQPADHARLIDDALAKFPTKAPSRN